MIETHSNTWHHIKAWAEESEAKLIVSLRNGTNHDDKIRGKLLLLEELMNLPDKEAPLITTTDHYNA